jgi:hypothetical protein
MPLPARKTLKLWLNIYLMTAFITFFIKLLRAFVEKTFAWNFLPSTKKKKNLDV